MLFDIVVGKKDDPDNPIRVLAKVIEATDSEAALLWFANCNIPEARRALSSGEGRSPLYRSWGEAAQDPGFPNSRARAVELRWVEIGEDVVADAPTEYADAFREEAEIDSSRREIELGLERVQHDLDNGVDVLKNRQMRIELENELAKIQKHEESLRVKRNKKEGSRQAVGRSGEAQAEDDDPELAALFDPVKLATLETMFPADGKWKTYGERAVRNGLISAREKRSRYNPYRAAEWWIRHVGPNGWDWAHCIRVLANNLPRRSMDEKHRLTGDFK